MIDLIHLLSNNWELFPLLCAYAETHYRFKYFPFSLYYRKEPEIIADAPYRIEPNAPLPISLIIKDADKFPITLHSVRCELTYSDGRIQNFDFALNQQVHQPIYYRMFDLDTSNRPSGEIKVNVLINIVINNLLTTIANDNHVGLSNAPLTVFKSAYPLPMFDDWYAGEMHCHTTYGPDQVEFGAPLEVYQRTSESMGLRWVALTDHSYNLDDLPDNYLLDDPKLQKWDSLKNEVRERNSSDSPVLLIHGEELSCRSKHGRNIHLLILNNDEFLIGTGDGAQKWLKTRSQYSVKEALKAIQDKAFATAAHPFVRIPLLERLLVNRGEWTPDDANENNLSGWQIVNGDWGQDFQTGSKLWNEQLQNGVKRYIYGGNDAHGNLNRFRQVRIPMLNLWENHNNLFGRVTTRIKLKGNLTIDNIITSLKSGKCVVSDGPMLDFKVITKDNSFDIGETAEIDDNSYCSYKIASTPEFGTISEATLFYGTKTGVHTHSLPLTQKYDSDGQFLLKNFEADWIRLEITSDCGHKTHRVVSNPLWLKK